MVENALPAAGGESEAKNFSGDEGKTRMPIAKILDIPELLQMEMRLPNVQRDFVWKPSQIENLWDSLLRRFPISAFIEG